MTDAIVVKHAYVSSEPDSGDVSKVQPENWNAPLVVLLAGVIKALAALPGVAGQIPFMTGVDTASAVSSSSFMRSLLNSADAPTLRAAISALNLAGDTMSGNLVMATNKVTGLGAPSAATDAATKAYVDALAATVTGALVYQGTWNAATNTPTLVSSVGTKGWYYKVSVSGTTTIDGLNAWNAGDLIIFNGTTWDKIDGLASEVLSVAGRTGAVVLAAADISDASANGRSLIMAANYAAMKTLLSIVPGDVSGLGSLATLSSITASLISDASANGRSLITAANYAAMLTLLGIGTAGLLNVGGGANQIVQLDGSAKLPAYDASQLINLPAGSIFGISRVTGLHGANNAGAPNTKMDWSALGVVAQNSSNAIRTTYNPTLPTTDIGAAGPVVNGRDQAGAFSASSWVHFYAIDGASQTLATLASAVAPPTGPTLPTGYTHWAYLGAVYVVASGNLLQVTARGSKFEYTAGLIDVGDTTTINSEFACSIAAAVPPNALRVNYYIFGYHNNNGQHIHEMRMCLVSGGAAVLLAKGALPANYAGVSTVGDVSYLSNTVYGYYYNDGGSASNVTASVIVRGYSVPNGGE
jgi:hypothetical protein